MVILTLRQQAIVDYIRGKSRATNQELRHFLETRFSATSRITITRELAVLLENRLLVKKGQGRAVYYEDAVKNPLLRVVDSASYFSQEADARLIKDHFDFEVFDFPWKDLLSLREIRGLEKRNEGYQHRLKKLTPAILKKEWERLTIEFSWKSSHIEGNTYTLLETERLIKGKEEARGHGKEEAMMILNHKQALEYVHRRPSDYKQLSLRKIEDIHRLLVRGLKVDFGVRRGLVGIIGTRYKPLDNPHQIREAMESAVALINQLQNPFAKALTAVLLLSYIQPFVDGNKRTARMIGNALLCAYGCCPLSYRSVDEGAYKKAVLLFYEQQSAVFFKTLFIEQFQMAVENYFL
jgi:Fic family protein